MITLTRINGSKVTFNDDLIERVEANPDTIVVLQSGDKYIVRESVEDIIAAVRTFRASVMALADHLEVTEPAGQSPVLHAVPDPAPDADSEA